MTKFAKMEESVKKEIENYLVIMRLISEDDEKVMEATAKLLSNVKGYENKDLIYSDGKLTGIFQKWYAMKNKELLNEKQRKILLLYLKALNKEISYSPENISSLLDDYTNILTESFDAIISKAKSDKEGDLAKLASEIVDIKAKRRSIVEKKEGDVDDDTISILSTSIPTELGLNSTEIKKMPKSNLISFITSKIIKIPLETQKKIGLGTISFDGLNGAQQKYVTALRNAGFLDISILEHNPSIAGLGKDSPTKDEYVKLFGINQIKFNELIKDEKNKKFLEESIKLVEPLKV
jgi:hypothetical protein